MSDRSYQLRGVQIFECGAEGAILRRDRDATELITAVWKLRAELLVIPIERLDDDFFRLRTRMAGEVLQKFVQYRVRVAILGDISSHLEESSALRDFVSESNRGHHVWFVENLDELDKQLERHAHDP